ncbi:MAG: gliding motility-associated C-terminal domain-containing protein, partial [Clostridia bacterium]|nr:gliding motility-associated C-terminal domain-containing protein [Clostridia bacterium]
CQNSTAPSLPTTSDNGVVGTWSPTSIDTSSSGTYTYTFTSNSTCDVVVTMDIVITPQVTPTFTQIGTLCQNSTAPVLPTTSDNGVVGVWSPATIDTSVLGTLTYTFTPSTTCDVTVTMDVTIASETLPTFAITSTYCQNEVASALPTTSDNGIVGTWLPASIDTSVSGVTTYEFTPNAGQCASSYTLTVSVDPTQSISFDGVDVCSGSVVDFPTVTAEGYTLTGTWSPSVITTTTNSTYTFTPSDSCYGVGTFEIVVNGCTIPKGFSPNGDGNNDTWDLSSFNIKKVEVFNRYGLKVYSKRNYVNEWGGKSDNGDELPTGTYYYMIDFEDRPSVTGWVYINRGE